MNNRVSKREWRIAIRNQPGVETVMREAFMAGTEWGKVTVAKAYDDYRRCDDTSEAFEQWLSESEGSE